MNVGIEFVWRPYMIQLSYSTVCVASEFKCQLTWRVDFTAHKNANEVYTLCVDSWGAFRPFFSVQPLLFFFQHFLCFPNFIIGVNTTEDGWRCTSRTRSRFLLAQRVTTSIFLVQGKWFVSSSAFTQTKRTASSQSSKIYVSKCRLPRTKSQAEKNTAITRI